MSLIQVLRVKNESWGSWPYSKIKVKMIPNVNYKQLIKAIMGIYITPRKTNILTILKYKS